ncbi:MAG: hypothetical protein LBC70_03905 [Chitinispirillales bacterium]|jgi:hypothetical protein|nr:hypothetical protein [Chitinispirillales bacterium]
MNDKHPPTSIPEPARGPAPEDEINLLEIAYVLVKYKALIALFSIIGLVGGFLAARAKGPTYIASAVIMAKESDKQAPNLGAFGAFGSFAAGQLNLAGNPGLDKIEIHFDSRRFKAELIEKYDLLDDIYRLGLPKVFRRHYDTTAGRWMEDENFSKPIPMQAAGVLSRNFFGKEIDGKKGTMTLSVKSSDPLFTTKVIEGALEHLNDYIRTDVQHDSKNNINFLEQQLITIIDPLLREKLLGMIAAEIEKAMVISNEAFKIIDKPFRVKKHREKIIYPVAAAFGMFLATSAAAVFLYYILGGGNINSESQRWVKRIRRELFRIF